MEGHESHISPKKKNKKKNKDMNCVVQFFKELKENDEIRDNSGSVLVCGDEIMPPKSGKILSVSVYPSEFGLKCMEIEATCGPSALLDMQDDDDKVHDDGDGYRDGDTSD